MFSSRNIIGLSWVSKEMLKDRHSVRCRLLDHRSHTCLHFLSYMFAFPAFLFAILKIGFK